MIDNRYIGSFIKQKRKENGLTQEELAKKVGYLSRSSVNKVELGKVDLPQSKLNAFANALNFPLSNLISENNSSNKAYSFTNITNNKLITIERIESLGFNFEKLNNLSDSELNCVIKTLSALVESLKECQTDRQ